MHRVYEVVEVLPDGSRQMVFLVSGLEFAKAALEDLANRTQDECLAIDAKTHQVVMQVKVDSAKLRAMKRAFQIADDEEQAVQRTQLLKSQGYTVMSVNGNDAAKAVLGPVQHYYLFIVGQADPEETRRERVDWLRASYPRVKILALNPLNQQIPNADYNASQNGPENWLAIISGG